MQANSDGSTDLLGGLKGDPLDEKIFVEVITQGMRTMEEIDEVTQKYPDNAFRFVQMTLKIVPAQKTIIAMFEMKPTVPISEQA
jgi:hypothetical protein